MPNIVLPAPGGDENVWGQKVNTAILAINTAVDNQAVRKFTSIADAQAHLNEIPDDGSFDVLYPLG